jgi:hypothetical protein
VTGTPVCGKRKGNEKMKQSLKHTIVLTAMGRLVMVIGNILLTFIIISIIIELSELLMTARNDTQEMIEACNGIAIILYGYGVALELREPFLKHLKFYPALATPLRSWVDELCHKYGIFFILLGLSQEILVHLITIPNRAFNTAGDESYIFAICVFIQTLVCVLLARLSYLLARASRLAAPGETVVREEWCDAK